MKLLPKGDKKELKQPNLIKILKGWRKFTINNWRNSRFITRYYSEGVDNDEWEMP